MARCFAAKKSEKPLDVLQNDPVESNSHCELSSSAKWKLTIILPFFPCKGFKYQSNFLQPILSE